MGLFRITHREVSPGRYVVDEPIFRFPKGGEWFFVFCIIGTIVAGSFAIYNETVFNNKCTAKGGVTIVTRNSGMHCFRSSDIIPLD